MSEESKILEELETTSVFNMRPAIKNYIENNVQLHRTGMSSQMDQVQEKLERISNHLNKRIVT